MIFSISIPTRGQARFLRTALESIRCQSSSVELAVMDATPDDSVQEVIRDYRDLIVHGYHRPDGGQAEAIQDGWNRTTGEIVAWLNADDLYFPGALAAVEEAFHLRPDVDVVFGHAVNLDQDGAFCSYFPVTPDDPQRIHRENVICQPACFVRRSAMERVGGLNTRLHYVMDWDFWIRLVRSGSRFLFIDSPLAAVTVHPETKTMSGARARYREISALLAPNVSPTERVVSVARMRCHDYLSRPAQGSPKAFRPLARVATSIDWRLRRPTTPLVLFGIEVGTQQVTGECVVQIPWYLRGRPAVRVEVIADVPVNLRADLPGAEAKLIPEECVEVEFGARRREAHRIGGALSSPVEGPLMTVTLRGDRTWRIFSLRFLPD